MSPQPKFTQDDEGAFVQDDEGAFVQQASSSASTASSTPRRTPVTVRRAARSLTVRLPNRALTTRS